MPINKPILCLDFDGVLHSYTSRWKGADFVVDPPTAGAKEALKRYATRFDIQIFSSRSHQPGGIEAMAAWCSTHNLAERISLSFPQHKPPALITLDDRALTFIGVWPTLDELLAFRPWNKK